MKDLLNRVKKAWEIIPSGPENEILRNYAEESRIFTKQYAGKLFLVTNNLMIIYVYNIHIIMIIHI